MPDGYESPSHLLARLKIGREEYCQRLLTTLVLNGPYPKWNSRNEPSAAGVAFLQQLDKMSFGDLSTTWSETPLFVDEFELPGRLDAETGGAPDYAVIWSTRLWVIELKTEAASHRHDQIPSYSRLGHHHHPDCAIDITYVTPTFTPAAPVFGESTRYAHVTWAAIRPLVVDRWFESPTDWHRETARALVDAIDHLDERPSVWRQQVHAAPPVLPSVGAALEVAELTAADGAQRALDARFENLEELLEFRVEVRDAILSAPEGAPVRHVRPWTWQTESTGQALTAGGAEHGYELRLSRYERPM